MIQIQDVDVSVDQARIRLFVPREVLFTSELPDFDRHLLDMLPGLWSTVCHNEHGLHFVDELRATEMGHVVEHVVLALLIEQGIYAKGTTEWNWFEEPEGTFTITISDIDLDPAAVKLALVSSLDVLDQLLRRPSLSTSSDLRRAETPGPIATTTLW